MYLATHKWSPPSIPSAIPTWNSHYPGATSLFNPAIFKPADKQYLIWASATGLPEVFSSPIAQ